MSHNGFCQLQATSWVRGNLASIGNLLPMLAHQLCRQGQHLERVMTLSPLLLNPDCPATLRCLLQDFRRLHYPHAKSRRIKLPHNLDILIPTHFIVYLPSLVAFLQEAHLYCRIFFILCISATHLGAYILILLTARRYLFLSLSTHYLHIHDTSSHQFHLIRI
jgi:hypothetical protein